jgi:hypothetical protein
MQNTNKHYYKTVIKTAALICTLPLLCAWVTPVVLSEDNTNSITINDVVIKSCTDNTADTTCHRWNLIWESVNDGAITPALTKQIDWQPNIANDSNNNEWRLPTIKELTRLINFGVKDNSTLIESPTIKNWFTSDANWPSLGIADGSKAVWLISSTFRDIDINEGDDVTDAPGQAQIFAINIINGEIKTFEPGTAGVDDEELAITELKLCVSLKGDGTCNYPLDAVPENIIFSLKVRTQTVQDLI